MRITEPRINALEAIRAWAKRKKIRLPKCAVCRKKDWVVGQKVVYLADSFARRDIVVSRSPEADRSSAYPIILLICGYCGHMLMFGAYAVNPLPEEDGKTGA